MKRRFDRFTFSPMIRLYNNPWIAILTIAVCFVLSWIIVRESGGTKFAHLHVVYFPVVLAAFRFRVLGGIVAGLVGMIVMGPIMPLDVLAGEPQELDNWVSRGVYLCLFGLVIGLLHDTILSHQQELFRIMNYDPVTNLPLFEAFRRKISAAAQTINDPNDQHVILNFEITTAVDIRTSFGNDACEDFIKACANRIKSILPEESYLARGGHATFLALIEHVTPQEAGRISNLIVCSLQYPVMMRSLPMRIDSRIGMVVFPDHGTQPDDLVRKSFAAMLQTPSKFSTASVFNEHDDTMRRDNLKLLADLGQAIERKEIVFYAQPKLCARTGLVRGCELLVRWKHGEEGMIPPDRFIPLAEKSRLIYDITSASIEAARTYMMATEAVLPDIDYHIAINVSGWDVTDSDFPSRLKAAFKDDMKRLPYLELEITETSVIEDLGEAKPILAELRDMGVHIAIDDFGTGFSSFSYLKDFPADTLKIDQSFVREVMQSSTDAILVRRTIELSKDLNLKSIAEGVEDKEAADWLTKQGCDMLQGYWIAKPMPLSEWPDWLKQNDPRAQA
ncbi:putative bifunctional diguanylate cyclase/phosphodiesterase [Hwanghaeella sp. LZ110]|uniref:putative bifunctional diguanylate cyclase/phosphodiesterase n=1 Tax=Hwanghaeella sp. LZ110 TaxID=3402810 RepID=UPI003B66E5FC